MNILENNEMPWYCYLFAKFKKKCLIDSDIVSSVNSSTLKEAYYGLVTLVIEAAKTDRSLTDIRFCIDHL